MMRVDVFSAKGGVGKTTIAFRLARRWAKKENRPVLLVDADLSGTCLGDLLQPSVLPGWQLQRNLIHLVCGRPERLPEELDPSCLPVYELLKSAEERAERLRETVSGSTLLFCPSNTETYLTVPAGVHAMADLTVLQALLGHESAGGWVGHVIDRVIAATARRASGLAAVIVDHSPGIGALQWSQMSAIESELDSAHKEERPSARQALFVGSRDIVDLAAARTIDDRIGPTQRRPMRHIRSSALWVLNRLPAAWAPSATAGPMRWKTMLEESLNTTHLASIQEDVWFRNALPVFEDAGLAAAYANSGLPKYLDERDDLEVAAIHEHLTKPAIPPPALP